MKTFPSISRMRLYGSLLMILISPFAQAQVKNISGHIYDYKNRAESLVGVTIIELNSLNGATTNEDGKFELSLSEQAEKIAISMVGYKTDTLKLPVANNFIHFLKQEKSLDEVVIQARKKSTEIHLLGAIKTENIGKDELLKSACCNLSESFETTPSIDVAYTDAITGYKQIQMLGLAGVHTAITRENIPDVRGLASITGLTYTPGAWLEGIQLSKGTGSVVNGFEGLGGQLNVEWRKPFGEEKYHFNLYQNSQGRTEANIVTAHDLNEKISTNILFHGKSQWLKVDQNNDNYMDQPLDQNWILANRWFVFFPKNYEFQIGVKGVYNKGEGGQLHYSDSLSQALPLWIYTGETKRLEAFSKMGKVWKTAPWRSMGWQNSWSTHEMNATYGLRNYKGEQNSFYSNLIFQTIIDNTNHVIKTGASFQYDNVVENSADLLLERKEHTSGAFAEYTYNHMQNLNVVVGLRGDYNNLFGFFATPRLHVRYSPWDRSSFRLSAGRAQRTPNVLAENIGFFASGRNFILNSDYANQTLLKPEVAWNFGGNYTQKFRLNYLEGNFTTDYYYTRFSRQLMVDFENPASVRFYNLQQPSSVHSFQAQFDYEPARNLNVRLAYRYYNAVLPYGLEEKQKALLANHRAFINVGYATRSNWKFDVTYNRVGKKRVPSVMHDGMLMPESYSPAYNLVNAQISKTFGKALDIYVGAENLTNYMQHNLILNGDAPFSPGFDASVVWGPAMGRNIYGGLRYTLFQKKSAEN